MHDGEKSRERLIEEPADLPEPMASRTARHLMHEHEEGLSPREDVSCQPLSHDLLDSLAVGIVILDRAFRVVWMNRAQEGFLQLKRETLLGREYREIVERHLTKIIDAPSDFSERILSFYSDSSREDDFECHVTPGDGREERWLRCWSQPIRSGWCEGGRIEHYSDISRAKAMEETLHLSREKYRHLCDGIRDGIVTLDRNRGIIECNRAFREMLGYGSGELSRMSYEDIAAGEGRPQEEAAEKQAARRGYSDVYEGVFMRSDGSELPVELRTYPVIDRNGVPSGTWKLVRDISRHKTMERELRQTREHLENVIENAVDAIGIVDRKGRFVVWNRRAEEIFGYRFSDIKGMDFVNIYADKRALEQMLALLRKEGVLRQYEIEVLKKDGRAVPMELSINLLKDDAGETVGSVCVARDLTEKKSMEAQLLHAAKMEAVGTLSGGIAHDFNNLLQAIHGYAELLLFDRGESDEGYDELQEIVRAARRGGELTKQLLTFSRKTRSELRPVNLNREVRKAATLLDRTIPKMIHIELHVEPDLRTVSADPTQIEQVLVNLVLNSKDAMPDGGSLTLSTRNVKVDAELFRSYPEAPAGDYVLLCVTDTGLGMDEETRRHIFDPFFTTKEVGKGTGLGLSTVYGIVKSHHGHIVCESSPGKGATFKILLPAIQNRECSSDAPSTVRVREGGETILVVDDESFVLDLCRQILTRYGYTVLAAPSAQSALDLYARGKDRIALVILDLIMPGMGGKECLAALLEIDSRAIVILLSGYSDDASALHAREAGARAFVRKPFRAEELLDVVRGVLDADRASGEQYC